MASFYSLTIIVVSAIAIGLVTGKPAVAVGPITAAPDAPSTSDSTSSIKCDYSYCDEHDVSWCYYFIPFKTFDPRKGPLPGETRVSIGTCKPVATDMDGSDE